MSRYIKKYSLDGHPIYDTLNKKALDKIFLVNLLNKQQEQIKIRNEIIKEFCQNVEYETPQVNATFKKAINLMNLHLVQS